MHRTTLVKIPFGDVPRAYRAKKLRKVKLSRGGAEGNQAFVKDMESGDYCQPTCDQRTALAWAVKDMDFKTLAAA